MELAPTRRRARLVFAAAYLALQAVLVGTAGRRPERAFGFRMFGESTSVRATLLREIDAPSGHGRISVTAWGGEWSAADAEGQRHHFEWRSRVKDPVLSSFDVVVEASYGADAEVARMQAALDDVAAHLDGDADTRRLLVDLVLRRNGRDPVVVHLASADRAWPPAP